MGYIDVSTAAKKWNVSERSVRNYCQNGRVPGALQDKAAWLIPDDAEKPARNRKFNGAARQNRNQNSGAYKGNSIGTESFEQIDITTVDVGSKVHVLCGGTKAVEATVIEMAKDVVGVELVTGMVIRVSPDRIGR